jgi:coproporphyrinogen III oxidase
MTMTAQKPAPIARNFDDFEAGKDQAAAWFKTLRDTICATFEHLEDEAVMDHFAPFPVGRFEQKVWDRPDVSGHGGGGVMSVMRGRLFEKVGVNISTVWGELKPDFRANIPGGNENNGQFWATGLSLVAHMRSPHVPNIHMNTRMIVTDRGWFGGGIDLNPALPDDAQTAQFHGALKATCDAHDPTHYSRFKDWCDTYFHLPHRNCDRGVGGIFFDYLNNDDWAGDFGFVQDVGKTFVEIFPALVRAKMGLSWTDDEREKLLAYRGRYAEFNLLYDRGTQFGLKTGGNTEAILMSLPPEARWP